MYIILGPQRNWDPSRLGHHFLFERKVGEIANWIRRRKRSYNLRGGVPEVRLDSVNKVWIVNFCDLYLSINFDWISSIKVLIVNFSDLYLSINFGWISSIKVWIVNCSFYWITAMSDRFIELEIQQIGSECETADFVTSVNRALDSHKGKYCEKFLVRFEYNDFFFFWCWCVDWVLCEKRGEKLYFGNRFTAEVYSVSDHVFQFFLDNLASGRMHHGLWKNNWVAIFDPLMP